MANLAELIRERDELLKQVDNNEQFLSGNTNKLFYETQIKNTFTLYIPAYLRLIFNSIEGMDFKNLKADVHGDLYFTLNVKDLPNSVADHVKKNIRFLFANDPEIAVKEEKAEEEDQEEDKLQNEIYFEEEIEKAKGVLINHYYHFHVRQKYKANMVPHLFLTPFETIDLILFVTAKIDPMKFADVHELITIQHFPQELINKCQQQKPQEIKFLINLMDHHSNKIDQDGQRIKGDFQQHATIDYGIIKNFGNYSVADKQLMVEYSNQSVSKDIIDRSKQINFAEENEEDEEKNLNKMRNFQFAHFHIKVYRNPISAACTIFVPVLLLTIINIGIFFQIAGLSGRIENIAGLMFAYTAILLVIREQIPVYHSVTLLQIIVYALTLTTLLCLIEGIVFQRRAGFSASLSNPLLLATIIVSGASTLIVIGLLIWHRIYRLHRFTSGDDLNIEQREGAFAGGRFDPDGWGNQECDKHFMKFFDSGKIRPSRNLNKKDPDTIKQSMKKDK